MKINSSQQPNHDDLSAIEKIAFKPESRNEERIYANESLCEKLTSVAKNIFDLDPAGNRVGELPLPLKTVLLDKILDCHGLTQKCKPYLDKLACAALVNKGKHENKLKDELINEDHEKGVIELNGKDLCNEKIAQYFAGATGEDILTIDLSDSFGLSSMEWLSNFPNIKFLNLSGCSKITSLKGLENCKKLEKLDISNCNYITDISSIVALPIRSMNANHVSRLKNIEVLSSLPLEILDLSNCRSIPAEGFGPLKEFGESLQLTIKNVPNYQL